MTPRMSRWRLVFVAAWAIACGREPGQPPAQMQGGPLFASRDSCTSAAALGGDLNLSEAQIDSLQGSYELTVVATEGSIPGGVAHGQLMLLPTDSVHRYYPLSASTAHYPHRKPEFLLAGWTTVDLRTVGAFSVATSPASRDPDAPGVQVDRHGQLIIGNPVTPTHMPVIDGGVYFFPHHRTRRGFSGSWIDGGTLRPAPLGYFCAVRIGPPRL
ncbi:MAG: hypothetical protein IRY91_09960 [Gemmatimonadaceae bacterium]|nr:hypothetical protein [Gemmatimonadaceae bacterium]